MLPSKLKTHKLVFAALALLCAARQAVRADQPAQETSVAEQTVNALNKVWGSHAGLRANHTKGIILEGSFTATSQAARLSKAALFSGQVIPITVRFSDSSGLPAIPDGDSKANPHGMAIKFHLPGSGGDVDVVMNSLKFFPVATGAEFRDLLLAISMSGPGAPKPTKVAQFMASHPAAPRAFASIATPVSFAQETYNGVDAFVFVDAAGHRQPFRFKTVPAAGTKYLSAADAAKQKPDFLVDELPARLSQGPVQFHMLAQLAAGDQTKDPTQPWPASRTFVDMGTITVTKPVADQAGAAKSLLFLPGSLTAGIEPSDDPLIDARNDAYAVSFSRRSQ